MGMSKPFHKPSVKKPPHVKKFSTQRYSSLCRDSKFPPIWMLVHCGAETSLGPQLGTSRLSGRPAFGLTPSEPRGPSLRPLGSSCPSVNSIHSWVFSITALGAVVLSKELLLPIRNLPILYQLLGCFHIFYFNSPFSHFSDWYSSSALLFTFQWRIPPLIIDTRI